MSLESALASGRRAAEARMTSTATIRRKSGMTTDADGFQVTGWVAVYSDIQCRIAGMARSQSPSKTLTIGGVSVQVATRTAHFPHDTADLRDGDLIELTFGEVAGTVWRIVEADAAEQQTARRVPVIATDRPEEWS